MARKTVALLPSTEGAYAAVLAVLKLDSDLETIALDEEGKQRFKENNLKKRERQQKCIAK